MRLMNLCYAGFLCLLPLIYKITFDKQSFQIYKLFLCISLGEILNYILKFQWYSSRAHGLGVLKNKDFNDQSFILIVYYKIS